MVEWTAKRAWVGFRLAGMGNVGQTHSDEGPYHEDATFWKNITTRFLGNGRSRRGRMGESQPGNEP
jgi:hypothetical protein